MAVCFPLYNETTLHFESFREMNEGTLGVSVSRTSRRNEPIK